MTVTIYDYPYSPGTNTPVYVTGTQQSGLATLVPSDGSSLVAVVFPSAYVTAIESLQLTIVEVSAIGTYALTVQGSSLTLTGFNIYVAGGPAGSTCTVSWTVTGT